MTPGVGIVRPCVRLFVLLHYDLPCVGTVHLSVLRFGLSQALVLDIFGI